MSSVKNADAVAPSAGEVELTLVVDGSLLAPRSEQSAETLRVWTSLSRFETHASIEWEEGTGDTLSKPIKVTVPLDDEYEADALKTRRFEVNGALRRDAAVWFEVIVEETATNNIAGITSSGSGIVYVSELFKVKPDKPIATALTLHAYFDPKTNEPLTKGAVRIDCAKFKDARATADFVHSKARKTRCELTAENMPYLSKVMEAEIMKHLAPFTDSEHAKRVTFRETMKPNAQIIVPWRMTPVGQLWPCSYAADDRAGTLVLHRGEQPLDEKYMRDIFVYALRRYNWTVEEALPVLQAQLKEVGAAYDDNVTELMSIMGTGLCLLSTSLPYKSDTRNLHTRKRNNPKLSAAVDVESYDDAAFRLTGDCEDFNRLIKQHANILERGTWKDPLLQTLQRYVRDYYVPTMNVGSVTSPSLGNEHNTGARAEFPDDHDVEKTAAHLRDAERHHRQIEMHLATGAHEDCVPRVHIGDDTKNTHGHTRVFPPDTKEPLGGHSWGELIPLPRFVEMTRRIVSDVDAEKIFGHTQERLPAWTAYLPHQVLEGTGRLDPLVAPRVCYVVNGDHNAVRTEAYKYQQTLHALLQFPEFRDMESQARQGLTVHVPNVRHTAFYRQSTVMHTDKFLNSTGGVGSFYWVRTHALNAATLDAEHDPLQVAHEKLNSGAVLRKSHDLYSTIQELKTKLYTSSAKRAAITTTSVVHKNLRGGAFAHLNATDATEKDTVPLNDGEEQAVVLGDLSNFKTLLTDSKHDAAHLVDAAHLSLGVDLEERIAWPLPTQVALVPGPALSKLGASVLRTYQRHLPAFVIPSKKLPMLGTSEALRDEVGIVRLADERSGTLHPEATARLVRNATAVQKQHALVRSLAQHTSSTFADRPWLSRAEAKEKDLTLVTMFFKLHDITNDTLVERIAKQLQAQRQTGLIYTANFYVEEPTQHIQNGVLRLLCKPPPSSSTQ